MAEIKVPELAETITEGTVAQWLKKPGDFVQKGEYVVELETDKVNVEIISEQEGVLSELKAQEGDTVKVGEVIAVLTNADNVPENGRELESVDEPPASGNQEQAGAVSGEQRELPGRDATGLQEPEADASKGKDSDWIIASPAARKLAREKGIDLNSVPAADPLGRIRRQDVSAYEVTGGQPQASASAAAPSPKSPASAAEQSDKRVERIRMSRRRQTIANRLVEVQQTAAMLTTFNEVDMSAVMQLRKKWKDKFYEDNEVRLGFMSFFAKAVVAALKKTPLLNAEIQGDEILLKKYYDIGVAVAADEGLVVPVIRDADRKNFAEIERDIMELAEKARTNKLSLKDLQGGTFTITNGGVFGSLLSTPILNGPQVGILGMHSIQLRPVAIDKDRMENRPMMYIALSYDHRIVDGKEAVTFLKRIKELIEDPESLLLQG
ncbi:2-oxoglutarate dehydrogenase complex dihydrolipoyllysine-residue succinyltransferase [Bacillus sp. T33-2]|uniref:2-oxoglutarate dehydrogenase complex dihydrolipoyllysine-residue succinyltransferase n=1 Tax=Bacillus sp. T33-2 TaxID=2054168 RepID=UPI000C76C41C|nr:2-oxoglutarate dehydrogenase complex dihydrolipoyllysine-residue succinyltransferase [Bacillus sp. T33-2]PLR98805.1 dihydrolipoyllysine-residue succinyltransferase [Bacillus sp. T33-2]